MYAYTLLLIVSTGSVCELYTQLKHRGENIISISNEMMNSVSLELDAVMNGWYIIKTDKKEYHFLFIQWIWFIWISNDREKETRVLARSSKNKIKWNQRKEIETISYNFVLSACIRTLKWT